MRPARLLGSAQRVAALRRRERDAGCADVQIDSSGGTLRGSALVFVAPSVGRAGLVNTATLDQKGSELMTFTAPDGTVFDNKREFRKYMFVNYYSFQDKVGETLGKLPGQIEGQEFQIKNCQNCTITLCDHLNRAIVENCTGCKILIGASKDSVLVRNCSECTFTVACQQVRVESCSECTLYVWAQYETGLENSHHMTIGPFNGAYSGLTQHFEAAALDPVGAKTNKGLKVHDYHKDDPSVPRPRFTIVRNVEPWDINLEGATGSPENPTVGGVEPVAPPQGDTSHVECTKEAAAWVPPAAPAAAPADEDPFEDAAPAAAAAAATTAAAEGPNMLVEWAKANRATMEAKDAENSTKRAALREKAEEELEEFYSTRTNTMASRAESNRAAETEFKNATQGERSDNPWENVLMFVDIKQDADGPDLSRMRSLLLNLKGNPLQRP